MFFLLPIFCTKLQAAEQNGSRDISSFAKTLVNHYAHNSQCTYNLLKMELGTLAAKNNVVENYGFINNIVRHPNIPNDADDAMSGELDNLFFID